ncbi:hypothetical protein GCM10012275_64340 [Longimycelium tulufanense]|uniref:Uncharacterized protein n=1 Tax=Longimycelium tulufanense TaxID=907463 RepID=A0A8J3FXA7_9PSEU|nr:hypothetical protein [Longimycelium tulufanense]GGM84742.1 hypothetical protein GCM10012275_64340 [Longimycelium tulufanense]
MPTRERKALAAEAVHAALDPELAQAVLDDEAFGALAWHLSRAAATGAEPAALLADLDPDDLAWAPHAEHPAAFLASRLDY